MARGRSPAETNRAVAGLSTNSSTSPPSPRPPGAVPARARPAPCPARSPRRSGRCAPDRRRGGVVVRDRARTDATRSAPVRHCARRRPRRPTRARHGATSPRRAAPATDTLRLDAPHQDRRHHRAGLARAGHASAHGRSGNGRRPAELLPWNARGARRDGRHVRDAAGRAGQPVAILQDLPGPEAAHRPAARGRRRAHAGRAADVPLRR